MFVNYEVTLISVCKLWIIILGTCEPQSHNMYVNYEVKVQAVCEFHSHIYKCSHIVKCVNFEVAIKFVNFGAKVLIEGEIRSHSTM